MTIKNTKLGGSDFNTPSDRVKPTDLNDTFDVLGDVVNKSLGILFSDTANLIWNADMIGFDSELEQEWNNIIWDTLEDSSKIDKINGTLKSLSLMSALVMDECSDSSVDTNIWSDSGTGSVTEGGDLLRIQVFQSGPGIKSHTLTADQVNAEDLNDDMSVFLSHASYSVKSGSGSATPTLRIELVDESANTVVLRSGASGSATSVKRVRINIDATNNTAQLIADDWQDTTDSAVDISSLQDGDKWHLQFYVKSDVSDPISLTTTQDIYFVRYNRGTIASPDFISTEETSSETITNAILAKSDELGTSTSIDYYLSADNGSNYEAVTPNEIHRFSNTGTQLKVKAILNSTTTKVSILNHYAVKYNLY